MSTEKVANSRKTVRSEYFIVFLTILTMFAVVVFGIFVWRMIGTYDTCKKWRETGKNLKEQGYVGDGGSCPKYMPTFMAIWSMCFIFIIVTVFLGWLWYCCFPTNVMGIVFMAAAVVGMIFFITLLALYGVGTFEELKGWYNYNKTYELSIGIIGMILLIGAIILGVLGIILGISKPIAYEIVN